MSAQLNTELSPIAWPKLAAARATGSLSRLLGRGGGTSLPGKLLLRLQPDAIARLGSRLTDGSVVISATNGKTTTAGMLAAILRAHGEQVVHNSAGANMPGGVATALLARSPGNGSAPTSGLFEVDEAWLAPVANELEPRVLVLANLFRDQLDRYGELEKLADSWSETVRALPTETAVVLNADDPLVAGLGEERADAVYFGIDDTANAEPAMRHAADSKDCRRCGHTLAYEAVQLAHLGHWRCPNCDAARPRPDVSAVAVTLAGMDATSLRCITPNGELNVDLPLPGLYNVYNALAAIAAAHALAIPNETIAAGLASVRSAFGRVETIEIEGSDVPLLLIKNPTGANEVLRTITASDDRFALWIALNDKIADGRDVSWIWDADFEQLAGRATRVVCSGTRADDIALRLAYAGVSRDVITVEPAIFDSFRSAAADATRNAEPLRALPTYTSLLELRTALADHGYADEYWNGAP